MRTLLSLVMLMSAVAGACAQNAADTCPADLPQSTVCYRGVDANGAYYLIAVPKNYNHNLVLFMHGGGTPPAAPIRTWGQWGAFVQEGYAMAGSSFRKNFSNTEALEDTKTLKQTFVRIVGAPRRTIGLGISAGGVVATKAAEHPMGTDGTPVFDGIMISCGFTCGHHEQADAFLDMRAVFQYYCRNFPRPNEPQYPLWRGLPLKDGEAFTDEMMQDMLRRTNECTGIQQPPEQRTPQQRSNLANLLNVTKMPPSLFLAHWPLFLYVTARQYDGNVASNIGVQYRGSTDDKALNKGVARYAADPEAVERIDRDLEPTGDLAIPVLSMHGIGDQIPVESEAKYAEKVTRAGKTQNLAQVYFYALRHCDMTALELDAAADAMLNWIDSGVKATAVDLSNRCMSKLHTPAGNYGARACLVAPDYQPKSQLGAR